MGMMRARRRGGKQSEWRDHRWAAAGLQACAVACTTILIQTLVLVLVLDATAQRQNSPRLSHAIGD
jgi:hypothetical protein